MKARNLIAAATLAVAASIAAPAMANISTGNLALDVQSALGSGGNVSVTLDNGVATLSGNVDGISTKVKVRQAALSNESVERVIDLVAY